MKSEVFYARVPSDLKQKVIELAKSRGKQQSEMLIELIEQGLLFETLEKERSQLSNKLREMEAERQTLGAELQMANKKLNDAQRAKIHLERILSTEVGRCLVPGCGLPVTLNDFAFQQCPNGHSRNIELHEVYKKMPGVKESLVAGLAIIGGIAIASELLGPRYSK